jgi:hypothetical protein
MSGYTINWLAVYTPLLFTDPDEYVRRVKAALELWALPQIASGPSAAPGFDREQGTH